MHFAFSKHLHLTPSIHLPGINSYTFTSLIIITLQLLSIISANPSCLSLSVKAVYIPREKLTWSHMPNSWPKQMSLSEAWMSYSRILQCMLAKKHNKKDKNQWPKIRNTWQGDFERCQKENEESPLKEASSCWPLPPTFRLWIWWCLHCDWPPSLLSVHVVAAGFVPSQKSAQPRTSLWWPQTKGWWGPRSPVSGHAGAPKGDPKKEFYEMPCHQSAGAQQVVALFFVCLVLKFLIIHSQKHWLCAQKLHFYLLHVGPSDQLSTKVEVLSLWQGQVCAYCQEGILQRQ